MFARRAESSSLEELSRNMAEYGKVVRVEHYPHLAEALEAVGLTE
jgi:hypothetical protein